MEAVTKGNLLLLPDLSFLTPAKETLAPWQVGSIHCPSGGFGIQTPPHCHICVSSPETEFEEKE